MGRKSSRELVRRIAGSLKAQPQTVQDVATAIDADHTSVRKYLESLAESDIIDVEQEEGKTKYKLPDRVIEDTDTYFGLRLDEDQRERLFSLFALIKERWNEKEGFMPSPTQAQKVAVRVLDKHSELDVPYGWYLYGSITVGVYDSEEAYEYNGLPDEENVKESIDEAIDKVAEPESWDEVRLQQYREEGKELYLAKERISALLTDYEGLGENTLTFEEELEKFMKHLPPIKDAEAEEVITEFVAIAPKLIRSAKSDEELQSHCSKISEAFNEIWDVVALYEFYDDLQDYYDRDRLDAHLMPDHRKKKNEAIKAVSTLTDRLPRSEEPDNPYYQQLKDLEGDNQEVNEAESDIFREFGIE